MPPQNTSGAHPLHDCSRYEDIGLHYMVCSTDMNNTASAATVTAINHPSTHW